ncbi:MAG: Rab family GTPase [Candidatus Thorarchaeota archaeon]
MGLFRRWREKRRLRYIPSRYIYEAFHRTFNDFTDDLDFKRKVVKKSITKKPEETKDLVYKSHTSIIKQNRIKSGPHYRSFNDATFKVILFGDSNAGKEQLVQRFLTNLFKSDTKMTIGVDFEVKSLVVADKKIKLHIWDVGGEERFRFLLPTYVRGANGALFIYDVSNSSTLAHIDDWFLVAKREIKSEREEFPILVVGLFSKLEEERQVPAEEGITIAKSKGADGFAECSPITGENVEEIFEALASLMLARAKMI